MAESRGCFGSRAEGRLWILLAGAKPFSFRCSRTMFALARCTETICHYMSKCKTRAPCIVMCHLFKLLGPLDSVLPVMWHRQGSQDARTHRSVSKLSKRSGLLKLANLFAITCKLTLMSDKTLGEEEIPNDRKSKMAFSYSLRWDGDEWSFSVSPGGWKRTRWGKIASKHGIFSRQFLKLCSPGGNIYCLGFFCFFLHVSLIIFVFIQCIAHFNGGRFSCLESLLKINQGCIRSILNQSWESLKNKPSWFNLWRIFIYLHTWLWATDYVHTGPILQISSSS